MLGLIVLGVLGAMTVVMVAIMPVVLKVFRRPACGPVEGEERHTPGIERCQACHQDADRKHPECGYALMYQNLVDDELKEDGRCHPQNAEGDRGDGDIPERSLLLQ